MAEVTAKKIISDAEFMAWAESLKPCRYCRALFVGPICDCERELLKPLLFRKGRRA